VSTRITTGMVQRNVLADLNRVNDSLTRTHMKISSGKEITRPSDDPFNTARALARRESLEGTQQFQRNVSDARSWQEITEQALGTITDSVGRVKELLVQGGSDTLDQAGRDSIKAEIDQLLEGVKQEANASVGGRYVFGGTKTDTPPYQAGANDAFQGNTDPMVRALGPGVSLPINVVGEGFLGNGQAAADNKLLHVLRDISDHLAAGDTSSLRGTDLTRLDGNLDQLLAVRAGNGSLSNRLEAAGERLDQIEETTTQQLSEIQDADIAKTMIDFNSQSAAYQAALKAGANIIQPSLMDFLH
jgi:flagellar hook-associated protein 3 FlgL